ncbi:uncharacterized protein H6S33_011196 [Morchella sextelata]|uniref:uncharacterized protein n=1 Tax=Morchella sextelata TaxID=1174677 RepID=UPI001D048D00|nr:uncharacterized protein H6S33_011196 [Morchella sextelata]KAH0610769.1 hypothetical protein H6S33_011196 [Morchella sextelata]
MKWTADNDQLLFVKLIETHDVAIKAEKIREAWPKDGREVPTARAISERILRIRNGLKNANKGDGTGAVPGSVPSTPRKRKNPAASVTGTPRTAKSRRVAATKELDGPDSPIRSIRKPAVNAAVRMAHVQELGDTPGSFDACSTVVDAANIYYSFGNYGPDES